MEKEKEKPSLIRLPPGFRFHPTDEELVVHYLKRKAFAFPLPAASIIPELNIICKHDPWDLPGNWEKERYFFSYREVKYCNGNRCNRATSSGYWKSTGIDKQIVANNQLVGMKKTLVFYRGKPPNGSKTDWIMHEYRLVRAAQTKDCSQNSMKQMEDLVLCRIFTKKKITKIKDQESTQQCRENRVEPLLIDFMMGRNTQPSSSSSSSSSSASSGITEVSSIGSEDSNNNCHSVSSSYCRRRETRNLFN